MRKVVGAALLGAASLLSGCDGDGGVVPPLTVARVEVAPTGRVVTVGDTLRLTGFARTAEGEALGGIPLAWSLEGEGAAELEAGPDRAVLTARGPGVVRVVAEAEGKRGEAVVTVMPVPLTAVGLELTPQGVRLEPNRSVRMEAVLRAGDGTAIGGRPVTWRSSNPPVATVQSDGNGALAVVSTQYTGRAVITASSEGFEASAEVVVDRATPVAATVVVTPGSRAVWQGLTHAFEAEARSATGAVVDAPVTWLVEDTAVARVSGDGLVEARGIGSTRVVARAGDVTGWASVKVVPQPGDILEYDLLPTVDPSGAPRPPVVVSTAPWTDPSGVEHVAYHWLMGGALRLDRSAGVQTYVQELEVWVVTLRPGTEDTEVVEVRTLLDRGDLAYDLLTGSYVLVSTDRPGVVTPTDLLDAELLVVRQAVEAASTLSYMYRLR